QFGRSIASEDEKGVAERPREVALQCDLTPDIQPDMNRCAFLSQFLAANVHASLRPAFCLDPRVGVPALHASVQNLCPLRVGWNAFPQRSHSFEGLGCFFWAPSWRWRSALTSIRYHSLRSRTCGSSGGFCTWRGRSIFSSLKDPHKMGTSEAY